MNTVLRTVSIALAALCITSPALAQSQRAVVAVEYSGSDQLGSSMAFALREEVRKSSFLDLAPSGTNPDGYRVILNSIGVENDLLSAYSVVLVRSMPGVPIKVEGGKVVDPGRLSQTEYVSSTVGYCGRGNAAACARGAYEGFAEIIEARLDLGKRMIDALRGAAGK